MRYAELRAMIFWFDVEDLITHFQHEPRPTGIQRLTFEIYRELWKSGGASGQVRFCRHGRTPAEYIAVDWPQLEAGILAASAAVLPDKTARSAAPVPATPAPAGLSRGETIRRYLYPRINATVRMPLSALYRSQKESLLALRDLCKALLLLAARPGQPPTKFGGITMRLSNAPAAFAPGDIFVSLGASWGLLNAAAGRQVQQRYGLRFAVLIHDLIPELYPEWTSPEGLPAYRAWLRDVVPHADEIFVYSRHTAGDLLQRMAKWDKPIPAPVVIPVGHRAPSRQAPAGSPFERPFILFVSTIEARKNHALLFRLWRRLLETMPAASVPYLVFAGKTAWLTGDLLAQLQNADWLDGHIKLVESPSEPELAALYAHCAFTVFPSLYEGWGLPVTESLSFGKTVAASNRSAIPEAGGAFCRYFDPEHLADAYAVIRFMIENPAHVRAAETLIAENFRPPGWADSAAALLGHLRSLAAAEPPGQAGPRQAQGGGASAMVAVTLA